MSIDIDDTLAQQHSQFLVGTNALSSSPPQSGRCSPPSTVPTTPASVTSLSSPALFQESLELQVDYWTMPMYRPPGDSKESKDKNKGQDQGKNSIKSFFRHLQVHRLPAIGDMTNGLTLYYATREKKQKSKMRA
jgi:phosphofurin acidic cluster sorting protein 2